MLLSLMLTTHLVWIGLYMGIYNRDKEFNYLGSPFRLKKIPKRLKKIYFCHNRELGMVNVYFYQETVVHFLNLLTPITFLIAYLYNWYLNSDFLRIYFIILMTTVLGLFILPGVFIESINYIMTLKHFKTIPRKITSSMKVSPTDHKYLKTLSVNNCLNKELLKYCYTKEKGILFIQNKDLERIRKKELIKYKHTCEKTEYNEKGQPVFTVYDRVSNRIIFQAPIKM